MAERNGCRLEGSFGDFVPGAIFAGSKNTKEHWVLGAALGADGLEGLNLVETIARNVPKSRFRDAVIDGFSAEAAYVSLGLGDQTHDLDLLKTAFLLDGQKRDIAQLIRMKLG